MPVYPISQTNLNAIEQAHDASKPIFMLNLWRFRAEALYAPEHAHLSSGPCTGREATERYRAAIQNVLPPNTRIHFLGDPEGMVAGPKGEKWDLITVVRYESLQGFRDMVESQKYNDEVEPHRVAGLDEWRLVAIGGIGEFGA